MKKYNIDMPLKSVLMSETPYGNGMTPQNKIIYSKHQDGRRLIDMLSTATFKSTILSLYNPRPLCISTKCFQQS